MNEMDVEMEMEIYDRSQDVNSDQDKIVPVLEGAQNVNEDEADKIEGNSDAEIDIEIPSVFLFDEDRRYTKEDLKHNFLALKWAAWLKMSPFGVDENSKNFPRIRSRHKKWWQNVISFCWFLFASVRVFIMILSAVHFGMNGNPKANLGQMTLMIALTTCNALLMYVLSWVISNSQNMAPFLSSIFKYLDAGADAEIENRQKKIRPRKFGVGFGGHTLKELLIIVLPFLGYLLAGISPLLSVVDPSFPFLLVSLVEPGISFSFVSLAAVDTGISLYYIMISHKGFYLFMGMHRITEEAGLTIKHLKTKAKTSTEKMPTPTPKENENENKETIKIQKALKNLGLLHIWTRFFNRSFLNLVYGYKLIALTAAILGGFGFIKMMEVENVPYAGILGLGFLEGIIVYNVIFGRAFEIPEKVEDLKTEIRKQSFILYKNNPFERKYVEKYLRSIPWLGVKDGVYKMERLTCVNFISFVVQQITSLILTY